MIAPCGLEQRTLTWVVFDGQYGQPLPSQITHAIAKAHTVDDVFVKCWLCQSSFRASNMLILISYNLSTSVTSPNHFGDFIAFGHAVDSKFRSWDEC